MDYCIDAFWQKRIPTKEILIGKLRIGGNAPIRVQSMTTTDTMDTQGSVEQAIKMIDAGCEIVRLTAPSKNEAENLKYIKKELEAKGFFEPLVADIHFTPNAAEIATEYVEKIRVNPGNYADKKKFETIDYSDETYDEELKRIAQKFIPLVLLCKKHNRAMRIGTNHGSLSDRILSRYGDTPQGMVASALEFINICEQQEFYNLVISMKASNTLVMIHAYRLLVCEMLKRGTVYPLHLGVTEAGEGDDGRIKSAVGIGSLLLDGIGDTIRVSLTEAPEMEIPVAQKLLLAINQKRIFEFSSPKGGLPYNPIEFKKRPTRKINRIGGGNVPVVIGDLSKSGNIIPANLFAFGYVYAPVLDKWNIQDAAADFLYLGSNEITFELPGTIEIIVDAQIWKEKHQDKKGYYPIISLKERDSLPEQQTVFCEIKAEEDLHGLKKPAKNDVIVLSTDYDNLTQLFRLFYTHLRNENIANPVILRLNTNEKDSELFQLYISASLGSVLIDGFGDGIMVRNENQPNVLINSTLFGILQATRQRVSKTEYISCPSCGRTLFDLQITTAKIREKTSHLKGLKIGIMGCIVNGPGEMADADYGYVGTGPGKINLYKEKTVVRKNVAEEEAVDALIDLIKENGDWLDPVL